MLPNHRFERQLALPGMNEQKQMLLRDTPILIVGAGGLGCSVFDALVRAGAEHISIIDGDTVSISNLHRQHLYTPHDIGLFKADVAVRKMKQAFGEMPGISAYSFFLNEENAAEIIAPAKLILDCSDDLSIRQLIDRVAKRHNIPWIYASVHAYETQLAVFRANEPAWEQVFSSANQNAITCSEQGVWGMVPAALGYQQALEAVKLICALPGQLQGEILYYNYANHQSYRIRFAPKNDINVKEIKVDYEEDLSAADINALLLQKSCRLIDVRNENETLASPWLAERIPMAVLYETAASWLREEPLILICHSGYRSRLALETLKEDYHFQEVYHLKGGLVQCQNELHEGTKN
ncbi:MAG: ThiF family adenylyltransferase [Chitinophagaceae bacterium]